MLSTVVLPAPLGPMTDMISPRGTSKLTLVTACTPPNDLERSCSSRMAPVFAPGPTPLARPSAWAAGTAPAGGAGARNVESLTRAPSREPPLPAAVVLHVTITLALPHPGEAEVELLDVLVLADRLRVA